MEPSSVVQSRRDRLLKAISRASVPLSTVQLSRRMGWSLPTTRAHLHALQDQGLVVRFNYRRWVSTAASRSTHANPL
jgi:predicted ArsR family transcriptional regulator